MQMIFWLLIATVFSTSMHAIELAITQPGIYVLGDKITVAPSGPDTLIQIGANNVILDLNNLVVSQSNSTANVDGIILQQNLTSVTIKNGIIRGVSQFGMAIGAGCSRITLDGLRFENCAARALTIDGTAGTVRDISITGCRFTGCSAGLTGDFVMNLRLCTNVLLENALFSGNGSLAGTLTVVNFDTCRGVVMREVYVQNHQVATFTGFALTGAGYQCSDCAVRSNSASTQWVAWNCSAQAAVCTDCAIAGNTGGTAGFIGMNFSSTASGNSLTRCRVYNNSATANVAVTSSGFFLNAATNHAFNECLVMGNAVGANNTFIGYRLFNANNHTFIRSHAFNNGAAVGGTVIAGMALDNANFNSVVDCIFMTNQVTGNPAASIGVNNAGTSNLFVRNIGFANNTTVGANQFPGIALGSRTNTASTAVASVTIPWTNLSVPS